MPIMKAPASGVRVRMYRQGHGDCFLMAFRGKDGDPHYVLIDCGLKRGSEVHDKIEAVAEDIRDSTGGHLNVVVVTHEHEDHVSGFLRAKAIFGKMKIDQLWLAWTEDPSHALANKLRKQYKDTLIGLVAACQHLQLATAPEDVALKESLEDLLGFEMEDGELPFGAKQPKKIKGITNKKAIKLLRDRAALGEGTRYLRPNQPPLKLPDGTRVFVLGPPEDEKKLKDMNPRGDEEFHLDVVQGTERTLLAAARERATPDRTEPFGFQLRDDDEAEANQPFAGACRIELDKAGESAYSDFFDRYYGAENAWQRIDNDWLGASEEFALRMSSYVNNTSLVLAFELPSSRQVLLFVGDAQRGNWVSWSECKWSSSDGLEDGEEIDCDHLLARTVLYKVGHHGSHNATLRAGGLQKMATGASSPHFVAMLPANEHWAKKVKTHPWQHPLEAIYDELIEKTRGRVFQSDRDQMAKPAPELLPTTEWKRFQKSIEENNLYFEYTVGDD